MPYRDRVNPLSPCNDAKQTKPIARKWPHVSARFHLLKESHRRRPPINCEDIVVTQEGDQVIAGSGFFLPRTRIRSSRAAYLLASEGGCRNCQSRRTLPLWGLSKNKNLHWDDVTTVQWMHANATGNRVNEPSPEGCSMINEGEVKMIEPSISIGTWKSQEIVEVRRMLDCDLQHHHHHQHHECYQSNSKNNRSWPAPTTGRFSVERNEKPLAISPFVCFVRPRLSSGSFALHVFAIERSLRLKVSS
ncbi:hypothetical protein ZHAS_00012819 [Anopheles sinensis]|uniref:Uncharacterized protein n=1 Tax=Anopheles sinensis TaxID=74873 RepID=A0A084W3W3_ANOSI|nr:hypothetical protein ZHAS_00012819 [Anopheles sinensis]